MMKTFAYIAIAAIGLVLSGCSGDSTGDIETAAKASAAAPKSADQLPQEMPPEARASAAAAMGQAQAAQAQAGDPARIRAMQEMQRQRGQ